MLWVRTMNNIRNAAEKIVLNEIVAADKGGAGDCSAFRV